jgi:hypothetical protein
MLRRTSKRVKEVVDKMRLPAVVRLSRRFWQDTRNGTKEAKLEFVFRQLAAMTARITTLELPKCGMKGQDAERLAGVLAQCPALAHLDLSGNSDFGAGGARGLQECWGSAGSWCTSISAAVELTQPGRQELIEDTECPVVWRDQPSTHSLASLIIPAVSMRSYPVHQDIKEFVIRNNHEYRYPATL